MFRATGKLIFAYTVLCASVLVVDIQAAHAQVKPFKISGGGIAPHGLPLPWQDARPHSAAGTATHLGKYHGAGSVKTDSAVFHQDGSITGEFGSGQPFIFVGANGDVLSCNYGRTEYGASTPGKFELVPTPVPGFYTAFFIAEFVPVSSECTGKFAGVTGSWVMYAVTEPFLLGSSDQLTYSWEGQGSLNFKK
jgi:hypothetical protein